MSSLGSPGQGSVKLAMERHRRHELIKGFPKIRGTFQGIPKGSLKGSIRVLQRV